MKKLLNPWVVGIATFLAVYISLGQVFDLSARCEDGWKSPSIGSRGACSHHGGVDRSRDKYAFWFSIIVACASGIYWHERRRKPEYKIEKTNFPSSTVSREGLAKFTILEEDNSSWQCCKNLF